MAPELEDDDEALEEEALELLLMLPPLPFDDELVLPPLPSDDELELPPLLVLPLLALWALPAVLPPVPPPPPPPHATIAVETTKTETSLFERMITSNPKSRRTGDPSDHQLVVPFSARGNSLFEARGDVVPLRVSCPARRCRGPRHGVCVSWRSGSCPVTAAPS
jgi:hypothetical protein